MPATSARRRCRARTLRGACLAALLGTALLLHTALVTAGEAAEQADQDAEQELAELRAELEGWRESGDRHRQAETVSAIGQLLEKQNRYREAVASYGEALALWRQLEDPGGLASSLDLLGAAHTVLGESAQAASLLEEALALRLRLGQPAQEAQTRTYLGLALQKAGRWPAAGEHYEKALATARQLGDRGLEARLLNNLGGLSANLGEPAKELEYLEQALQLRRALGDEIGEATTLNNLGAFYRGLGEIEQALLAYDPALRIFERLGDRYWQARTLNNLGYAYLCLGEHERARAYFHQALPLRREVGDQTGEAVTLRNLGRASAALGESVKALAFYRRALDTSLTVGDRRGATTARKLLGELETAQHRPEAARGELELSLASLREMGNRREAAEVLELLSRAELALGEPARARELAAQALELQRAVRNPLGEIAALTSLARAERAAARPAAVAEHLAAARGVLATLHEGLGDPDQRAAFLATQRAVFELEVDFLIERHRREPTAGWDLEALEASERARSQSLLGVLERAGAARAGAAEPGLRERLRAAEQRAAAKTRRQLEVLGAEPTPEQARAAEQDLLLALGDLDAVNAEIRRRNPRWAALSRPQNLDGAAIRGLLDPETVLLEFFLGEERSFLWWVTLSTVAVFELPPRAAIEDLAERVYRELSAIHQRSGTVREALEALGQMLLGPVADRLGDQRLAIVADGALHFVPFAALASPASREPLVARHELVQVPSASVLGSLRREPERSSAAGKALAIFADPRFERADPLPYTRREAEVIAELVPPAERLVALGGEARRARVVAGELRDYRILHFATHGLANPRIPELSGLLLAESDSTGEKLDGFLGLRDVGSLELSARLVVLSGCRTALGKEVRGEGLIGLTRGFMVAGVPRVLASLWQVRDEATAELMTRFYRALRVDQLAPAAALRAAQLGLRQERRWRDPYYWAAFRLEGEWR